MQRGWIRDTVCECKKVRWDGDDGRKWARTGVNLSGLSVECASTRTNLGFLHTDDQTVSGSESVKLHLVTATHLQGLAIPSLSSGPYCTDKIGKISPYSS